MTSFVSPGERASFAGVRFVLFDAVGTLIYPDPPAAEAYHAAGQRFGSQLSVAEIRQRFRAAVAAWNEPTGLSAAKGSGVFGGWRLSMLQSRLPPKTPDPLTPAPGSAPARHAGLELVRSPTDESTERLRWQALVEAVFTDVPDAGGELFQWLWWHFGQAEHWRLYDDVAPVVVELGVRGYQLGIASNFDARLLAVAKGHPPINLPEATFLSSHIGYSKPDLRFFRAIEGQLGAPPRQVLLVGDDRVNDTAGARNAGWHAIELHRAAAGPSPDHIGSLAELLDLLPPLASETSCP